MVDISTSGRERAVSLDCNDTSEGSLPNKACRDMLQFGFDGK